jgi:hypothetical protein
MKLFVAVPIYRDVPAESFMCFLKLDQADLPFEIKGQFLQGQSLVSRARNWLTADFLETDYTHCLWIDADIIFTPQEVVRLASHDEAIVGGFCPFKKDGELTLAAEFLLDYAPPNERGLLPVHFMGAGFLLVRRDVFEKMLATYGDESWFSYPVPDLGRIEHDFWRVGVYCGKDEYSRGRYLNEDLFFQQNALDLGFTVYGDTQVVLKHIGTIPYPATSETMHWDGKLGKFVTNKGTIEYGN